MFGEFCTVNDFIDCPPDELFDYLADTRCLEEWTYSLRGFTETDEPGLWLAYDRLGSETKIYTRTVANREARTVDYHCAWDQGRHLWMIYLMRVVDAQTGVRQAGLGGAVDQLPPPVLRQQPLPEAAPPERPVWVGDFWDMFGAGHLLELKNLKAIAEYRHHNGLPITPAWMRDSRVDRDELSGIDEQGHDTTDGQPDRRRYLSARKPGALPSGMRATRTPTICATTPCSGRPTTATTRRLTSPTST